MENPVQYDARTKQQIKDAIYEMLYAPIDRNFKKRLERLVHQNALIGGYSHRSFIYKGEVYNCDTEPLPRLMNRLAPRLHPEMDEYLKDLRDLNEKELPYVLGFINQVLNASGSPQDYLRVLPEIVHQPIQRLVAQCPCRVPALSEENIQLLQERNKKNIDLIKQRIVINMLI